MAFKSVQADTRHACRDIAGALVTGQAGALVTALEDPLAVASTLAVAVVEIGTSGWYLVSFVPDATGIWLLSVTNPAPLTGDGQLAQYRVDVLGKVLFRPKLYAGYRGTGAKAFPKR